MYKRHHLMKRAWQLFYFTMGRCVHMMTVILALRLNLPVLDDLVGHPSHQQCDELLQVHRLIEPKRLPRPSQKRRSHPQVNSGNTPGASSPGPTSPVVPPLMSTFPADVPSASTKVTCSSTAAHDINVFFVREKTVCTKCKYVLLHVYLFRVVQADNFIFWYDQRQLCRRSHEAQHFLGRQLYSIYFCISVMLTSRLDSRLAVKSSLVAAVVGCSWQLQLQLRLLDFGVGFRSRSRGYCSRLSASLAAATLDRCMHR